MVTLHSYSGLQGALTPIVEQQSFSPSPITGPFQISNDLKKQRTEWIIQQRTLLIQDRQIDVLKLQQTATLLGIIAEILGLFDLEILSTND
ncbi:hypothetical protein ACTFRP_28455 [Bacillus cereus group sp. MYBK234-1]|uniref:hypothetical protein n=1 Tax=unclassified Bacillus cereus group TaxID=2750818 RepID=UPI003F78C13D